MWLVDLKNVMYTWANTAQYGKYGTLLPFGVTGLHTIINCVVYVQLVAGAMVPTCKCISKEDCPHTSFWEGEVTEDGTIL